MHAFAKAITQGRSRRQRALCSALRAFIVFLDLYDYKVTPVEFSFGISVFHPAIDSTALGRITDGHPEKRIADKSAFALAEKLSRLFTTDRDDKKCVAQRDYVEN